MGQVTKESRGTRLRRIYELWMKEREDQGDADKPVALDSVYDFAKRHGWSPPSYHPGDYDAHAVGAA